MLYQKYPQTTKGGVPVAYALQAVQGQEKNTYQMKVHNKPL